MINDLLAKIFGTHYERELKRMRPTVATINELEPAMAHHRGSRGSKQRQRMLARR